MTENERKAEIKSYYSQELLDGVKPMDAETAEFLWNMMNGIGEQRMKYTFYFEGQITVTAKSEEEAYELADYIVAPSMWAHDNCDEISRVK